MNSRKISVGVFSTLARGHLLSAQNPKAFRVPTKIDKCLLGSVLLNKASYVDQFPNQWSRDQYSLLGGAMQVTGRMYTYDLIMGSE